MTIITHVGAKVYKYDSYKKYIKDDVLYVTAGEEIMTTKAYNMELSGYIVENNQYPCMGFVSGYDIKKLIL